MAYCRRSRCSCPSLGCPEQAEQKASRDFIFINSRWNLLPRPPHEDYTQGCSFKRRSSGSVELRRVTARAPPKAANFLVGLPPKRRNLGLSCAGARNFRCQSSPCQFSLTHAKISSALLPTLAFFPTGTSTCMMLCYRVAAHKQSWRPTCQLLPHWRAVSQRMYLS